MHSIQNFTNLWIALAFTLFIPKVLIAEDTAYYNVSYAIDNFKKLENSYVCIPGEISSIRGKTVLIDERTGRMLSAFPMIQQLDDNINKQCQYPNKCRVTICGELSKKNKEHSMMLAFASIRDYVNIDISEGMKQGGIYECSDGSSLRIASNGGHVMFNSSKFDEFPVSPNTYASKDGDIAVIDMRTGKVLFTKSNGVSFTLKCN